MLKACWLGNFSCWFVSIVLLLILGAVKEQGAARHGSMTRYPARELPSRAVRCIQVNFYGSFMPAIDYFGG